MFVFLSFPLFFFFFFFFGGGGGGVVGREETIFNTVLVLPFLAVAILFSFISGELKNIHKTLVTQRKQTKFQSAM